MEDNRNSDRSEEELRCIIKEDIRRSRANGDENLYARTQAMIRQASSAFASSVNVDSGISSPLASSTSPSTNLHFYQDFQDHQVHQISHPTHLLLTKTDDVRQCTHTNSSQQIRSQL